METIKKQKNSVVGIVPTNVADYLLNNKRKEIFEMEASRDISIRIEGDPGMLPGQHKIVSS
jgi:Ribonuclease G/E